MKQSAGYDKFDGDYLVIITYIYIYITFKFIHYRVL